MYIWNVWETSVATGRNLHSEKTPRVLLRQITFLWNGELEVGNKGEFNFQYSFDHGNKEATHSTKHNTTFFLNVWENMLGSSLAFLIREKTVHLVTYQFSHLLQRMQFFLFLWFVSLFGRLISPMCLKFKIGFLWDSLAFSSVVQRGCWVLRFHIFKTDPELEQNSEDTL